MAGGYKFIMGKQTAVRCCSSIGVEDDHDSRSSGWSVAVGLKMTREANMGPEGSPTHWAGAVDWTVADTRALHTTRFCCASAVQRFSVTRSPVNILLRQAVRLVASCSQLLMLMFRSWREALMQSL